MGRESRRRRREGGAQEAATPPPDAGGDIRAVGVPAHAIGRADLALAALVSAVALFLYARTAAPSLFGGDSAELAAAAATFGAAHPPGYPLYTLITGLAVRVLPAADPAGAANLASGLYAAVALGLALLFLRRLGLRPAAALFAVAAVGVGATFWSQATVAEVYTLDLLLLFGCAHAALGGARSARPRAWVGVGLLVGLWIGHRPVNVLYLPGLLGLVWSAGGLARLRLGLGWSLAGVALSTLVYAYLPLASAADPWIDVGDPQTWERFRVVVSGAPYRRHLEGVTAAQALGRVGRFVGGSWRELGLAAPCALIGAVGLWRAAGAGRRGLLACAWFLVAGLGFASRYQILDIEVYFLPALAALAVLSGWGATAVLVLLQRRAPLATGPWIAAVVALAGLAAGPANMSRADLSWNDLARRLGEDLLASVGENALLFVQGDTSIHALWYLQAVEGRAPGVIVVSPGHLHGWYVEQLAARRPDEPWPPYEPARGQLEHARAILDALGSGDRPAYVSLSMPAAELIGPREGGTAYGAVPRGLVQEALPYGTRYDRRERALANSALLLELVGRLPAVPDRIDMDSKSILLQYALATWQNAEELAGLGEVEAARAGFRAVLALAPDRHERDVREDVRRGLGQVIPTLDLGAKSRRALAALDGR